MTCECGCGQLTPPAKQTNTARGWVKGQPLRFINGHNKRLAIRIDPSATEKACTACSVVKPMEDFHRCSAVRHGRKARCRDCEAEVQKKLDRRKYQHHQRSWQKRNPEKFSAQNKLGKAVRSGKIVRPDACSKCGDTGRVQGHHEDYSKPLEVVWLCQRCHKREHAS